MYLFFRTRIPRIVTNGIVRGSLFLLRMAEPQGSFVRIRAIRVRLIQLMCLYLLVLLISFPNTNPTNCHEWNRVGFFATPPHDRAARLICADWLRRAKGSCYSCSFYTIFICSASAGFPLHRNCLVGRPDGNYPERRSDCPCAKGQRRERSTRVGRSPHLGGG